jgi:hypothetical protein
MAKLAAFVIAAILGAALGAIGIVATVSAVSPSADHVADTVSTDPAQTVYGTR